MPNPSERALAHARMLAAQYRLHEAERILMLVATRPTKGTSDHGHGSDEGEALLQVAVAWDAYQRAVTRFDLMEADQIDWAQQIRAILEQMRALIRDWNLDPAAAALHITGDLGVEVILGPDQPTITNRDLYDVLGALTALAETDS